MKSRLLELQAALVTRGVRDVKFFVVKSDDTPRSKVFADAVAVLEAILGGNTRVIGGIGDTVR